VAGHDPLALELVVQRVQQAQQVQQAHQAQQMPVPLEEQLEGHSSPLCPLHHDTVRLRTQPANHTAAIAVSPTADQLQNRKVLLWYFRLNPGTY
jgi:hypothetical protein